MMVATSQMKAEHIRPLTGLRFFAAAMIADGHSWRVFGNNSYLHGLMLNHGVSIFFVLSGFILACSYPTIDEVRSRSFFLARFARIWPLHILSTMLLIILIPDAINQFFNPGGLLTAIHYLTLTHTWFPTDQNVLAYVGSSWSISTEAFFYLTFPLWIMDWGRFTPLKLPVAFMPVLCLMQYSNLAALPVTMGEPGISALGLLYFFPLARLPEFVLGVVLGQFWYRYRFHMSAGWSDAVTVLALAITYLALSVAYPFSHHPITKALFGPVGYAWFAQAGFAPIYALLIFVLASSTGFIARVLGSGPLVRLGEISFAIYLFHPILLRLMGGFGSVIAQNPEFWRSVYWMVVILASYLAFEFFEKPVRKAITGRATFTTEENSVQTAAFARP